MTYIELVYNLSTLQSFRNITDYDEKIVRLPDGYHIDDHKWTYIYNNLTKNKVGVICLNNNYFSINSDLNLGYSYNNYIIYIDNNELPTGTFKYIYNFKSSNNSTIVPSNTILYPTVTVGSDYYYNKKIIASIFNTDNVSVIVRVVVFEDIPKFIITSNVTTVPVYYQGNELKNFQDISGFDETFIKIPKGYHFRDTKYGPVYSMITGDKVGHIFAFNYFQNVDTTKSFGYCDDLVIIFIEKEFPLGSFGYTLDFISPNNTTNFVKGTTRYPTITCLTGDYFGKTVTLEVTVTLGLTRNNYFRIYT